MGRPTTDYKIDIRLWCSYEQWYELEQMGLTSKYTIQQSISQVSLKISSCALTAIRVLLISKLITVLGCAKNAIHPYTIE